MIGLIIKCVEVILSNCFNKMKMKYTFRALLIHKCLNEVKNNENTLLFTMDIYFNVFLSTNKPAFLSV